MPDVLTAIEVDLQWLGAIAGLSTLAYAILNMILAHSRPASRHTGAARRILRTRYLVIATLLFMAIIIILWRPLPVQIPLIPRMMVSLFGAALYFASLGLYIWGLWSLGKNFNASSGFGVRLQQAHALITQGPYAYIRHPMYLAVILACWGGLLLYRTWSMLICAILMFGLIVRAHKEEQALAGAFGNQWESYRRNVPGWFPIIRAIARKDNNNHQHRR
ncbi:MAG: hypothetical protein A2136_01865 [Chloroflexi bacterium RBG_16_54_11]|nr:MAG: hypothetical protein A2136_01865 [Chloroflexi bacterium RBG_16_54_11]